MVSGGMKCIKYLLFVFNLVLFIAGLALIIVGALVMGKFNSYFAFFGGTMTKAAINIIIVGLVIFVIGFFGCCGAYKENYCMVLTFAALLILVLVLEIAVAVLAYILRHQINHLVLDDLTLATFYYNDTKHSGVTIAWDKAQEEFHCCGAVNQTDWLHNPLLNKTESVPESCCVHRNTSSCGVGLANKNSTAIYSQGCVVKLIDWAQSNINTIGACAAGFGFIQIVGVVIACCLAKAIRREYEVV